MPSSKRLWLILADVVVGAFLVLGGLGVEVYRQAPPIPERVVTTDGHLVFTQKDILDGQQVWQSIGGQQVGSVWGHGAYQAPDWSADWLHREALALRSRISVPAGLAPAAADVIAKDAVQKELRHNTFDPKSGTLTISSERAAAVHDVARHYDELFGDTASATPLRKAYALAENPIPDSVRREKLTAFFFWTAWACTTERPASNVTYTNNWPHEPLVGNHPTPAKVGS